MKFTIGTASSNMRFEEDLKLIKSSLLYADEIELIGMAEYAIFQYLPKCLVGAKDIGELLGAFIPFLNSFDNDVAKDMVGQLIELQTQVDPYLPLLRKNKKRTKQEILAQNKVKQVEKQTRESLENVIKDLVIQNGSSDIQDLIDRNIITVYDYSYNDFGVDELVGGYFANMMATIKKGVSFPLFDSISSDVVSAVIDTKILDLSKTDKEIIRHAGVANNILSTLPTLEKASVDEILSFKREMKKPLDNFRIAIYGFSEKISSMPWDDDFKYDCLKLYDTEVVPRVNEINELSSETSVLKNFGKRVLEDEEARKRLGYFGAAGLSTTITTGTNIVSALEILENMIKMGSKIGLAATGITAFLKTADLLNKAHEDVKEKKKEMQKNVMYYYYKASDKIR